MDNDLPRLPGVYCIWLSNGGAYVGKTLLSIRSRVRHHMRRADGCAPKQYVHCAVKKHGISRIDVVVCGSDLTPGHISDAEIAEIDRLRGARVKLYNLTDGGDGKPGFKWADDTRAKIVPALTASWTDARKSDARARAANPAYKDIVSASQKATWTQEKKDAQRDRMRMNAPARKLTEGDVKSIASMLNDKQTCASISRIYGVTPEAISAIKTGKNWSYVTGF